MHIELYHQHIYGSFSTVENNVSQFRLQSVEEWEIYVQYGIHPETNYLLKQIY